LKASIIEIYSFNNLILSINLLKEFIVKLIPSKHMQDFTNNLPLAQNEMNPYEPTTYNMPP